MKKTFLTVLLFYIFTGIAVAQNLSKTTEYKILLTGASFASPQNGWFEIGCRKLNAEAINRACAALDRTIEGLSAGFTPDALLTDVEEAMGAIGEVTGRTVREDITNRIFERFCVGK